MMAPRKAKMAKKAQRASPAMTARGNATHHEQAAVMAYARPVTAKKVVAPTEMAMVSHPECLFRVNGRRIRRSRLGPLARHHHWTVDTYTSRAKASSN